MKNKFILLEMNHQNEIRADMNITIKSLGITEIEKEISFGVNDTKEKRDADKSGKAKFLGKPCSSHVPTTT